MKVQLYIISMILCGDLITYTSTNPIKDICGLWDESEEIEHFTIKAL